MPTIADVPEIVSELVDIPDAHLTNLGSKGLGEPPIIPTAAAIANAIRDATGADVRSLPITREEMLRALREARGAREGAAWSSCGRLAPRRRPAALGNGSVALAGGTELVPLIRDGLVRADTLVDVCRGRAARHRRDDDRRRHDARRARGRPEQSRRRCARPARSAASPQLRSMGTIGGNLLPGDALLVLAARLRLLAARRRALLREGRRAPRARDLRERPLRVGASVRRRGGAARARRDGADDAARAPDRRALPAPDRTTTASTSTLAAGRADPRARRARAGRVDLPEGDGPAELGVPARRRRGGASGGETRHRARRGRPDPLGARRPPTVSTTATPLPRHRVQGRDRARADQACARGSRCDRAIAAVVLAAGAASRFGSPKQRCCSSRVLARLRAERARRHRRRARRARGAEHCPDRALPGVGARPGRLAPVRTRALRPDVEAAVVVLGDGPGSTRVRSTVSRPRGARGRLTVSRPRTAVSGSIRCCSLGAPGAPCQDAVSDAPAELVACDDLDAPGDVDFADGSAEVATARSQNDYGHGARRAARDAGLGVRARTRAAASPTDRRGERRSAPALPSRKCAGSRRGVSTASRDRTTRSPRPSCTRARSASKTVRRGELAGLPGAAIPDRAESDRTTRRHRRRRRRAGRVGDAARRSALGRKAHGHGRRADPRRAPWRIPVTVLNGSGDINYTRLGASRDSVRSDTRIKKVARARASRIRRPRSTSRHAAKASLSGSRRQLGVADEALPGGAGACRLYVIVGPARGR